MCHTKPTSPILHGMQQLEEADQQQDNTLSVMTTVSNNIATALIASERTPLKFQPLFTVFYI